MRQFIFDTNAFGLVTCDATVDAVRLMLAQAKYRQEPWQFLNLVARRVEFQKVKGFIYFNRSHHVGAYRHPGEWISLAQLLQLR